MMSRLCGGFISVALAACGSAHAQSVPKGEAAFTEYVATQMRRAIAGETVKVEGPLTLGVGGIQANLDRIFAYPEAAATSAGGRTGHVAGARYAAHDQHAD
jgi:hypothetical protein